MAKRPTDLTVRNARAYNAKFAAVSMRVGSLERRVMELEMRQPGSAKATALAARLTPTQRRQLATRVMELAKGLIDDGIITGRAADVASTITGAIDLYLLFRR